MILVFDRLESLMYIASIAGTINLVFYSLDLAQAYEVEHMKSWGLS